MGIPEFEADITVCTGGRKFGGGRDRRAGRDMECWAEVSVAHFETWAGHVIQLSIPIVPKGEAFKTVLCCLVWPRCFFQGRPQYRSLSLVTSVKVNP